MTDKEITLMNLVNKTEVECVRLHALNAELLAALKCVLERDRHNGGLRAAQKRARTAIAKAEQVTP